MKCSLWPNSIKTRVTLSALGVFLLSLWMLAFLTTRILEQEIRRSGRTRTGFCDDPDGGTTGQ